jgi:hypothetical protein
MQSFLIAKITDSQHVLLENSFYQQEMCQLKLSRKSRQSDSVSFVAFWL